MPIQRALAISAVGIIGLLATAAPASAHHADMDGDGMPNRWEQRHGFNPLSAEDAGRDRDHDGLRNVGEFRNHGQPRDEDSDNDGSDDKDEVRDETRLRRADSNGDGELDGDEDADRDGIDNEDEDDTNESCRGDDDDRDEDGVADEDENEFGTSRSDSDSDDDGVADGNEDSDDDGLADEDEDDSDDDRCDGDLDEDGVDDEDEDVFGVVVSFDASTSTLEVNASGRSVSGVLSEDTEIEWTDCDRDDEPTTADLTAGTGVEELEFDDETGLVEEVTLIPPAS